jgi:asparagine synthase (glutamine-hydrolysing)
MCGIIGRVSRQGSCQPLQDKNLNQIKHRGPDDGGFYNDSFISMGHRRLSIIDVSSAGHQPMQSADGHYVITYNGEVYNYLEIKDRLAAEGVSFYTHSDTEVVLNAYIQWGPKCLNEFRGMYAFAIWDRKSQKLFIARDRCGEKPFIYYISDNEFLFCSEFKGLIPLLDHMPDLNPSVVDMYLHYQYAPEPHTLLKDIHKLPAAHYAFLDLEKWSFQTTEYWNIHSIKSDSNVIKQDIKDELHQAIKLTLRSDVPVGVALSGGIDSAGIAAIATQNYPDTMQAFCVGYPGRPSYDERAEAKDIAKFLGCDFNEVELQTNSFIDNFPDFSLLLDEPIADIAAYGHYAVPKSCSEKGIKVLLTGIGGDELFWGYDWTRVAVSLNENRIYFQIISYLIHPFMKVHILYKLLFRLSRTHKISPGLRTFCRKLLACIDQSGPKDQPIFMAVTGAPEFTGNYCVGKDWYGPAMSLIGPENAYIPTQVCNDLTKHSMPLIIMDLLFKTWLTSNCLSLGDRVSMSAGVETRLPLLDVRLIEKVIAYRKCNPDHHHGQKALLRGILSDILPQKTITRPKSGFVPPVTQWISGISKRYSSQLDQGNLVDQGIISANINSRNMRHSQLYPHTLYRLILLEQWYSGLCSLHRTSNKDRKY